MEGRDGEARWLRVTVDDLGLDPTQFSRDDCLRIARSAASISCTSHAIAGVLPMRSCSPLRTLESSILWTSVLRGAGASTYCCRTVLTLSFSTPTTPTMRTSVKGVLRSCPLIIHSLAVPSS
eukprot:COSAG02_NODE_2667_length_8294_cov_305.833435_9_plen_122_part_00